jgi:hypothetical protein
MSTTQNFESLRENIETIDANKVLQPDIPVDVFNQEAEDLYQVVLVDKEKLMERGLTEETIELLPQAAGACRYAEAEWNKERNEKQEAEREWKEKSPIAYELRNDLMHELEFAFNADNSLLSVLDRIKEGNGNADMIQDLMNLSVLGKEHAELLQQTNFESSLLIQAETMADEMSELLARANGSKNEDNKAKVLRDKAYTYLRGIVNEVRRFGKFVFRKDADHAAKYASAYNRAH